MKKFLFLFPNPEFDKRCKYGISRLYRIFCLEYGYNMQIVDLDFLGSYIPEGREPQVLVIAGGDGTIHLAINAIPREAFDKYIFGIIPAGTANEFAKSMNIPLEIKNSASLIANPRKLYKYHVGIINDKDKFMTGFVFGFENKILQYTPKRVKHLFGENAFQFGTLLFLMAQLRERESLKKRFKLNHHDFRTNYLVINNANLVSKGLKESDLQKSRRGLLSIIHIRTLLNKKDIFRLMIKAFTRTNVLTDPAICYNQLKSLNLEFGGEIGVMLDGEPYRYTSPVNIKYFDMPMTLISG